MLENLKKEKNLVRECAYLSVEVLFEKFQTSINGLSNEEVQRRLEIFGYNEAAKKKKRIVFLQLLSKILNPLIIVLIIIGSVSFFLGEKVSGVIVFLMATISVILSFYREYKAGREAEKLSELVRATATVYRNGVQKEVSMKELVPGDIIYLSAGDMIPADVRIISCKDLFINQATLTGESLPVEKSSEIPPKKNYSLTEIPNILLMGSSVKSGTAIGLVIATGPQTQFGELAKKLAAITGQTSFEKGVTKFTWFMIKVMIIMALIIFAINAYFKEDKFQALLFALSVAVGLVPEMLPMLVTVNLAKGAIAMGKKEVIVKKLGAIQNFGAMTILCTDKTGTLTQDKIILERYCDVTGEENDEILKYAYLNSYYQTGLKNALDKTILKHKKFNTISYKKVDEIPFDFLRKIMSVIIEENGKHILISKGAPEEIFKRCKKFELKGEILDLDDNNIILTDLKMEYHSLSEEGFRVLAIAYKIFENKKETYTKEDETEMILKGYIAFLDPPKPTVKKTLKTMRNLGIELKVLTGDNEIVTKRVCQEVGIPIEGLMCGEEIDKLTDQQLQEVVKKTTTFARLTPFHKERIIRALKNNNHTVGYLGDGINDALALKAADVGISVNNAVDIAKECADIILLKKSLTVIADGIIEGRKTFGNILKYIRMGASSNFGNMLSMTGASLLLPFLPMQPIQILLNNFLYDLSQIALPTDEVDKEYLTKAKPWNISYIRKFMIVFGSISSLFDFITFFILWHVFGGKHNESIFQTGWFMVSLATQTLVIHIIRTGKIPFFESSPSPYLLFTTVYIVSIGILIPFLPLGKYFHFINMPSTYLIVFFIIVLSYLFTVQLVKKWFIKRYGYE